MRWCNPRPIPRMLHQSTFHRLALWLEWHDHKTRDFLKVARICGQHGKAERQRCCTDEQVSERNDYTLALLLSVEFSGQHRRFFRVRVHCQVCQQFIEERLTLETHGGSFGSMKSVDEFREADCRAAS